MNGEIRNDTIGDKYMVYEESEEDMEIVGGFDKRPQVNLSAGMKPFRWVIRGFSKDIVPAGENNDEFESVRWVLMMPAGFEDEPTFEEEHVMSLSGKSIVPGAIKSFVDADRLKETGEVWLDRKWLNKECTFMMDTVDRPGDIKKGYSPMRRLSVSRTPGQTERKDLPDEFALCAGYQQPDQGGESGDSNTYSMD